MGCGKKALPNPETLEELIEILERESQLRTKRQRQVGWSVASVLGFYAVAVAIIWFIKGHFPGEMMSQIGSMVCIFSAGAAMTATHKHALQLATANLDPRLTTYFIEALSASETKVSDLAREALAQRLPAMSGDHLAALTSEDRARLAKSLHSMKNPAFMQSALNALQAVGGRESIPGLEGLTQDRLHLPKRERGEFEKVRISAKLVLADVRMRVAQDVIHRIEEETATLTQKVLEDIPEQARAQG